MCIAAGSISISTNLVSESVISTSERFVKSCVIGWEWRKSSRTWNKVE